MQIGAAVIRRWRG